MHDEILSPEQLRLLPLMKQFRREFYLVGGTAIALHLGHRRSIDFDMFKFSRLNHKKNLDKITSLLSRPYRSNSGARGKTFGNVAKLGMGLWCALTNSFRLESFKFE